METVKVKIYEVTVYSENLGIIVYKPFAVKGFDLTTFLSHQPPYVCLGFNSIPKTEKVPAWTVPNDIDFVE